MMYKAERGKPFLVGASILIWLLILISFRFLGYEQTWILWNVSPEKPPFLDFRLIPGSAESFVHGFEPSIENPYDPHTRVFNYPAFWRLFFYTGITQDDTIWIGILMIVMFFVSAFLFPETLSLPGALGMLLVLFSPASMLLYERANADLIAFVVCVMSVLALRRSAGLAALLIAFGSIVKMFPFFGISIFLKESKKKFLFLSAGCLLVLILYMAATWESVVASWTLTERGKQASYGTNVFVIGYQPAIHSVLSQWLAPDIIDLLLQYMPVATAFILLVGAALLAFRNNRQPEAIGGSNLAAFRMGASIYIGTFFLGNNWDYRLAFLVLVVPKLVEWMYSEIKLVRIIARSNMAFILLSCWHFLLLRISSESIFNSAADSMNFWIILDEVFNWLLFTGLGYLLFASTPTWVKELPGTIFSKFASPSRHERIDFPVS